MRCRCQLILQKAEGGQFSAELLSDPPTGDIVLENLYSPGGTYLKSNEGYCVRSPEIL